MDCYDVRETLGELFYAPAWSTPEGPIVLRSKDKPLDKIRILVDPQYPLQSLEVVLQSYSNGVELDVSSNLQCVDVSTPTPSLNQTVTHLWVHGKPECSILLYGQFIETLLSRCSQLTCLTLYAVGAYPSVTSKVYPNVRVLHVKGEYICLRVLEHYSRCFPKVASLSVEGQMCTLRCCSKNTLILQHTWRTEVVQLTLTFPSVNYLARDLKHQLIQSHVREVTLYIQDGHNHRYLDICTWLKGRRILFSFTGYPSLTLITDTQPIQSVYSEAMSSRLLYYICTLVRKGYDLTISPNLLMNVWTRDRKIYEEAIRALREWRAKCILLVHARLRHALPFDIDILKRMKHLLR
jgi:hypothetical protein